MQNLKSLLFNSRILLVLLVLVLFAGCSDDDKGSTGSSCGTCHSPYGEAAGGPDFSTSKGYYLPEMIGKYSSDYSWSLTTSNCSDKTNNKDNAKPLVIAGNPNESALLMAVASGYDKSMDCTSAYNYHAAQNATISGSELNDLADWISKQ